MTDQPKPPLWQIMNSASGALLDATLGEATALQCYGAELRALADWLVPEESSETFLPGEDSHNRSKRQQRRHLRATLLIEADRAEVGE